MMFGVGIGAYVWSYMARTTGNARATSVVIGAGVVAVIAFIVFYTILKFAFNM